MRSPNMFIRNLMHSRWTCWLCGLALASTMMVLVGLKQREAGLYFGSGSFMAVGDGCLMVGVDVHRHETMYAADYGGAGRAVGFYVDGDRWHSDWITAWRPFRATSGFGPTLHHFVVVPVWPMVLLSALAFGYSVGVRSGARHARLWACSRCGYDLHAVPRRDGLATCPECGLAGKSA